jgi:hypothetical protein
VRQAGSSGIVVAGRTVVAAVDPVLGDGRGYIEIPRLEFDSSPQCSPCQVGADTAAESSRRTAVVDVGDVAGSPSVVPAAGRPAVGMDPGCPRPARSRWADASWSPDATAGQLGDGGSLAIVALRVWGRSS